MAAAASASASSAAGTSAFFFNSKTSTLFSISEPLNIISPLDSIHDFGNFSLGYPIIKRDGTGIDFFTNFSGNIQRIILNQDKNIARAFTSKCKSTPIYPVVRLGLENSFLEYVVTLQIGKNINFSQKKIAFPSVFSSESERYDTYHKLILDGINSEIPVKLSTMPIIVDTTRTLSHLPNSLSSFFVICQNRENIADPSNTTKMLKDQLFVLKEVVNKNREYKINNITYVVSGSLDFPEISYSSSGIVPIKYSISNFQAHKLTEKEICKANIQKSIKELKDDKDLNSIQKTFRVKDLKLLYGGYCDDYNLINYNCTLQELFQIATPYVAKRGGDQLQVLSSKEEIIYEDNLNNIYKIKNCIFWTIDAMAAAFAILNGISVVLQRPDKTAILYIFKNYIPSMQPIVRNIKKKGTQLGGNPCTRLGAFLESEECYALLMRNKLEKKSEYYDQQYLLNYIKYILLINKNIERAQLISPIFINIENIYNRFNEYAQSFLNIENCLTNTDKLDTRNSYFIFETRPNEYEIIDFDENNIYVKKVIEEKVILSIQIEKNYILTMISNEKIKKYFGGIYLDNEEDFLDTPVTENKNHMDMDMNGGYLYNSKKSETLFSQDWNNAINKKVSSDLIFRKFIELLSSCEDKYFIVEDKADNFYAYDSTHAVRYGGHTQIEMMLFLSSVIYNYALFSSFDNGIYLKYFLDMFLHFPIFLEKYSLNDIYVDIQDFIKLWYNCILPKEINNQLPPYTDILFEKVISDMKKMSLFIYSNIKKNNDTNDTNIFLRFLEKHFPHGYFTIIYKNLDSLDFIRNIPIFKILERLDESFRDKIENIKNDIIFINKKIEQNKKGQTFYQPQKIESIAQKIPARITNRHRQNNQNRQNNSILNTAEIL